MKKDANKAARAQLLTLAKDAPAEQDTDLRDLEEKIRAAFSDDLRKPQWKGSKNPSAGHCYVASEVAWHALGGATSGWRPKVTRHEGGTHWFLEKEGQILDLTADQFETKVDYQKAKGCGFLTKNPSARARAMAEKAGLTIGAALAGAPMVSAKKTSASGGPKI